MIKSVKEQGISIRQACAFYNINNVTVQRWLKDPSIKQIRNKLPTKISNDSLLADVAKYLDDYLYERARRLNCSKSRKVPTGFYI